MSIQNYFYRATDCAGTSSRNLADGVRGQCYFWRAWEVQVVWSSAAECGSTRKYNYGLEV